ncbi:hypothetical protein HS088_TW19G00673 [Tripterygium wilfordii]|uniref:DUF7610 domain-containing protein n=1 Tax=Tripterygium wilfordii TaxID=458696 RepID=A0A7J7CAC6_TRIWF|nr:hypothetical protein HS088_TW19G00673 [Tripterygium wilfordii]
MAKRHPSILQKKLQRLESKLNEALSLPPDSPHHDRYSRDIEQRFAFLKTLLSAELASQPANSHHLQHIERTLNELEAAYHDWNNFKTSTLDHIDTASTCSCTESCFNDDEGDGQVDVGSEGFDDGEKIVEGQSEERAVGVEIVKEEEEIRVWTWKSYCRNMVSGMVIGMVLMGGVMVRFSGCFNNSVEYNSFVAPT